MFETEEEILNEELPEVETLEEAPVEKYDKDLLQKEENLGEKDILDDEVEDIMEASDKELTGEE